MSKEEFDDLRSQTGISSWGGRRYAPSIETTPEKLLAAVINYWSEQDGLASRWIATEFNSSEGRLMAIKFVTFNVENLFTR